jgi:hypothetical protein
MITKITSNIDFSDLIIINKHWRQFKQSGMVTLEFDNQDVMIISNEAGFVFDHASIPKIPFFRRWRWDNDLNIASYVHDIMFIHQYKDYKYCADIMNDIMVYEGVNDRKRNLIHRAVKTKIAERLFINSNERDAINKLFCEATLYESKN